VACILIAMYSCNVFAQDVANNNSTGAVGESSNSHFQSMSHKEQWATQQDTHSDSAALYRHGNLFLTAGAELMWQSYRDAVTSALQYKSTGPLPALDLSIYNRRPTQYSFTAAQLGTQFANSSAGLYYGLQPSILSYFNLNFGRCFTIDSIIHKKISWQLGYTVELQYFQFVNTKFENSAYSFAIWANAGLCNRFVFPFAINTSHDWWFIHFRNAKQYCSVVWQLNVPVAGVITRPNYAGIEHFANGVVVNDALDEIFQNIRFASFNSFVEVKSKIDVLFPLGNHNLLNIGYHWAGYHYSYDRVGVQGNQNSLVIGLQFKLDSRQMIH
jgi:hypothetical protein